MYKKKIYVVIYLSMILPVLLSAAPIDKYYVPPIQFQQQASQQQMPSMKQVPSTKTQMGESAVYAEFRKKVKNLSPEERKKLKESFQQKMDNAAENKNYDEAAYYQRLINILN